MGGVDTVMRRGSHADRREHRGDAGHRGHHAPGPRPRPSRVRGGRARLRGFERRRNPGGDLRRDVGCRFGAKGGDVAPHSIEGAQHLLGLRVVANPLAQAGRGFVVQQAGLQVGKKLGRQGRFVGLVVGFIHPPQCPSCAA